MWILHNTAAPIIFWPSTHSSFLSCLVLLRRETLRHLELISKEWKYVTVFSGNTQVSDLISYRESIIVKLILLPILAVIQEDCTVITTQRSHSNIIDLKILILNQVFGSVSSECSDCVLKKLCIGMPAIVVETASKNNNIDFKLFLINDFIIYLTIE